ncbi:MAG: hypothetical protein H7X94_08290 [Vallitaleaceae bacterium]|nr:hypothetical protein [Vallitaleaceae bacterium]
MFTSINDEALKTNLEKFNDLYETDLPYFSLYFMNSIIITNDHIYGELNPLTDNVFNGIQNVYISR